MTSSILSITLIFILIIVFILFAFYDKIKEKNIKIARINSLLDSYKKELDHKQSDSSRSNHPSAQSQLEDQIRTLQHTLSEKENILYVQHVNYSNLESSYDSLSDKLQSAQKEISILRTQLNTHVASAQKVENADRDFLLQELGDKNKHIFLLQSDLASLHHQIEQLRSLYPHIDEILALQSVPAPDTAAHNHSLDYLSQDEWDSLSDTQRNQLALDRYIQSHSKTKWQIGRDYELFVAHKYRQQGYDVDPCGSYLKLEDMGRDLILKKDGQIRIVQCKYWANSKIINERFIFLLYGAVVSYCIEHNYPQSIVKGIFVTNISLSDMAKKCAEALGILVMEQYQIGEFPRIKCNVKKDSYGDYIYIYHLPMDPQYDKVKITGDRECFAYTVDEAESYGFRRAQ